MVKYGARSSPKHSLESVKKGSKTEKYLKSLLAKNINKF